MSLNSSSSISKVERSCVDDVIAAEDNVIANGRLLGLEVLERSSAVASVGTSSRSCNMMVVQYFKWKVSIRSEGRIRETDLTISPVVSRARGGGGGLLPVVS